MCTCHFMLWQVVAVPSASNPGVTLGTTGRTTGKSKLKLFISCLFYYPRTLNLVLWIRILSYLLHSFYNISYGGSETLWSPFFGE
jgi:hypothetical protein